MGMAQGGLSGKEIAVRTCIGHMDIHLIPYALCRLLCHLAAKLLGHQTLRRDGDFHLVCRQNGLCQIKGHHQIGVWLNGQRLIQLEHLIQHFFLLRQPCIKANLPQAVHGRRLCGVEHRRNGAFSILGGFAADTQGLPFPSHHIGILRTERTARNRSGDLQAQAFGLCPGSQLFAGRRINTDHFHVVSSSV